VKGKAGEGLSTAVSNEWATPTSRDWKSSSAATKPNSRPLSEQVGQVRPGPLNPGWVEALMMFPPGWTDIPPDAVKRSTRGSRPGRRTKCRTDPRG
jgi:hypothetical protein